MNNNMDKESDYPIFQLAKTLQLHQVFGPMPSAQMLLQDILQASMMNQHNLCIQRPLNLGFSQYPLVQLSERLLGKQPQYVQVQYTNPAESDIEQDLPDPLWGNNWEASSSSNPQVTRHFIRMDLANPEVTGVQQTTIGMELVNDANMDVVYF